MNIAFPALLILLYIVPGVVFAHGLLAPRRYLAGSRSLEWSTQITWGIFFALPLHWIALYLWGQYFQLTPDLFHALILLDDKDDKVNSAIFTVFSQNSGLVTSYFVAVTVFALLVGWIAGLVCGAFGITFTSRTQWDDFFVKKSDEELFIEAVVERDSITYLYVGIYLDKMVDEKGMLRGIWLRKPQRRDFADEAKPFYSIQCDLLFLSTDKVQTLSRRYFDTGTGSA